MDGDRKYRQRGYNDTGVPSSNGQPGNRDSQQQKPRQQGPRPPLDVTGPRLPRLVQTVTASRCYNCSTTLSAETNMKGNCPKCNAALHCCKQCAHFEPSTRFQCLKPIPVRISPKDQANECASFSPRVTVARDSKLSSGPPMMSGFGGGGGGFRPPMQNGNGGSNSPADRMSEPRTVSDARAAFDSLFKK